MSTRPSPVPLHNSPAWHAREASGVIAVLDSSEQAGLSNSEAQGRLAHYGPNLLPAARPRGAVMRLLLQFHNPLIYTLLGAGLVTLGLEHYVDAAVIFGVVIINALIGFVQ